MVDNYKEILYDHESLRTPRLILRKFKKEDAPDILVYGSDPETLLYLPWDGVYTVEEALKGIVEYYWSRQGFYCIALQETSQCIGSIELNLDPEHEKASFGYVLSRAHWGNGYMTEALSALLRLCFETIQLNRVESYHYAGNEGSGKVMEKCGMALEGISKQGGKLRGIFLDKIHYGITRERWASL